MRKDPLPTAFVILEVQGQSVGALKRADFPTETLLTFEIGMTMPGVMFNWISQSLQGRRRAIPGSLAVLDSSLSVVHRDAWDCGSIQEIVFPAMEAGTGIVPYLGMAVQITNLREVPIEPTSAGDGSSAGVKLPHLGQKRAYHAPAHSGHRKDPLPFFCFKVEVDGFPGNFGVRKLGSLRVNLGPNVVGVRQETGSGSRSELVLTMAEDSAADFRTWKQSGGQRDITVHCLSSALQVLYTFKYKGAAIAAIHPAAPLSVTGDTKVTMKVAGVTFSM